MTNLDPATVDAVTQRIGAEFSDRWGGMIAAVAGPLDELRSETGLPLLYSAAPDLGAQPPAEGATDPVDLADGSLDSA